MKQFRWIRMVLLSLSLFMILSCASFPLPDNPWQSLLVISRDISNQTGDSEVSVTSVVLHYRDEKGNRGRFSLPPGKKPVSFAMDPGAYKIEKFTVHYQRINEEDSDSWTDDITYRLNFYIEKNTVIMFSKTVKASPKKNSDNAWVTLVNTSDRVKSSTLAELKNNEEFKAWSDYDLINF